MKTLLLGLASLLATVTLFGGNYNVDAEHTSVAFKVKHLMISNVKGSFDKFSGNFEYDEKTKQLKALHGTIEAASINTANVKRDGHLKSKDFFDVSKYPTITFTLTKVDGEYAYGDLSMHGVTKNIKLELENNGMVKDPWGNMRVGLALSGKINRKDFGLTYNSLLEAGGVAIGDSVKMEIEIEGVLQK
jgi:polyisoprenoid-binding protein YceI